MSVISILRQSKGMNQDQFAEYCGVSRISIARYEAGSEISRANAKKIAAACGVSLDYVLNYDMRMDTIQAIKNDEPFPQMIKPSDYDFVRNLLDVPPEDRQRVLDFVAGLKSSKKA